MTDAPLNRDAPDLSMEPASLLDHKARQRARLQRAAQHLWHRDAGAHRDDITALLRLVDADHKSVADAIDEIAAATAESQRAEHRAA
jgi:hypothetical protein